MKWLTREWHDRGFSDPESLAVWAEYTEHLNRILGWLNDGTDELVSTIHLHGGVVESFTYNDRRLELMIICGDNTRGYERLTLAYNGVVAMEPLAKGLDFLIEKPTELLHDEVDVYEGPQYEHRVLCWPTGEFMVRFTSLEVVHEPATEEDRIAIT
jgi:hypothetical protein